MTTTQETTYLLPPEAYISQEWFEREQRQLFEHTWQFIGVIHDLPDSGDFITGQAGRAPIVVVRGEDGEIRAFHNMCRHRGVMLVDGQGNCGKGFVCPYHRWNHRSTGELRAVPQRDQYEPFENADMGLLPVTCSVWKTLIFVHLQPDPQLLSQWLNGLTPLVERFRPEELEEVSDQRHEVKANWKLYVENHVDWLHLWYLHRDTLSMHDHAGGERLELDYHWASFESYPDSAPEETADSPTSPLHLIPGLTKDDQRNGAHFVFPSLTLFTNDCC